MVDCCGWKIWRSTGNSSRSRNRNICVWKRQKPEEQQDPMNTYVVTLFSCSEQFTGYDGFIYLNPRDQLHTWLEQKRRNSPVMQHITWINQKPETCVLQQGIHCVNKIQSEFVMLQVSFLLDTFNFRWDLLLNEVSHLVECYLYKEWSPCVEQWATFNFISS